MNQYILKDIKKKRKEFDTLCQSRHIPSAVLKYVTEHRDIPYLATGDPAHRLDVYRPTNQPGPLPVIINIHGGGLVMGSKEFNRHFCAILCKLGFVVFTPEYRLAPEVTVFDQLQDITYAMKFIDQYASEYGADKRAVYMVGDSGGALLALYTAALHQNPKVAKAAGVTPSALEIARIALISGMFYTTRPDSIGLFLPPLLYGKEYRKHPFHAYMNPEHPQVSLSLPPVFLTTSKHDNLRHYTMRYGKVLAKNYCHYILRDYGTNPSLTHAFPVFSPGLVQSRQVIEEIAGFFRAKYDILFNLDF